MRPHPHSWRDVDVEGEGQCSAKIKAQVSGPFRRIDRKARFGKKNRECGFGFAEFVALL